MGLRAEAGETVRVFCPDCRRQLEVVQRSSNEDINFCPYCAAYLCGEGTIDEYVQSLQEAVDAWREVRAGHECTPPDGRLSRGINLCAIATRLCNKMERTGYGEHDG